MAMDWQTQRVSDSSIMSLATSRGVPITSGVANTKGAWVLLATWLSYGASLIISLESVEAGEDFLVDIGTGTAASEVVTIANMFFSSGTAAGSCRVQQIVIPPSQLYGNGKIYARCQSTGASKIICVGVHDMNMLTRDCQVVTTYGADTADTGGVSVDPGGTAHTKGAYSEIVAAAGMTRTAKGFWVGFGGQHNVAMTTAAWLVDIAIGEAGSEIVIYPNIPLRVYGATSVVTPGTTVFIPLPIPTGTRIAARAQCSINDATDRLIDVIVYTVS